MSDRRTFEEEQEAVTGAVISIMHALVDMARDKEIESHLRILAASEVLAYARDTDSPVVEFAEDETSEEGGESEGDMSC